MTEAAWYADPDGGPGLRWWDGERWTTSTWPPVPIAVAHEPEHPNPGWYDDPEHPGAVRWWDGHGWTERFARIELPRRPASEIGRGRAAAIAVVAVAGALVLGVALVVLS